MTSEQEADVAIMVRTGYFTVADIALAMEDDVGVDTSMIAALAQAMTDRRREELEARHDLAYDRLSAVFDQLESSDVLVRENYWCCQTCAHHAIGQEIGDCIENDEPVRGYVLFHSQDAEHVAQTGVLLLRYGAVTEDLQRDSEPATKKMGEEIVALLERAGFRPSWSGAAGEVITLPIEWDKLPPTVD